MSAGSKDDATMGASLPASGRRRALAVLAGGALTVAGCVRAGGEAVGAGADPVLADAEGGSAAARPLERFFARLARKSVERLGDPLVIMQIGDSHTANDAFSGRLRTLFQEQFGGGGRGLLPPGIPYRLYRPDLVTVREEGQWRTVSSFGRDSHGVFGLCGFRGEGRQAGDGLVVESQEAAGFRRVGVAVLRQPHGGRLRILAEDSAGVPIATFPPLATGSGQALSGGEPAWFWYRLPQPARSLRLQAVGDGLASVLGVVVDRPGQGGVVVENLGVIGATVALMGRWDPAVVTADLVERQPALILLAYGTNEGFDDHLDLKHYARMYRQHLRQLQAGAPQAALAVLAAPDALRPDANRAGVPAAGLGSSVLAGGHSLRPVSCSGRFAPPVHLEPIRQIQKRIAAEENAFFWDWSRSMGGPCSMQSWLAQDPPLAMEDRVHLRRAGYAKLADAFFHHLMTARGELGL